MHYSTTGSPSERQVMVQGSSHDGLDIAIIGGGMAGISAADYLVENNALVKQSAARVTLFDKGRSLGGRCSGRRMGRTTEHIVHHGCQLLYPLSQSFQELCARHAVGDTTAGLSVAMDVHGNIVGDMATNAYTIIGRDSMVVSGNVYGGQQASGILDGYFQGVSSRLFSVHRDCTVTKLCWSEEASRPWKVYGRSNNDEIIVHDYDIVVVADWTAAMDLLVRSKTIPESLQHSLYETCIGRVEYLPTFALIVEIHSKELGLHDALRFETGVVHEGEGPLDSFKMIALQATEHAPDGAIVEYWVMLTSEKKSQALLSKYPMVDCDGKIVPQTRLYRQGIAQDMEQDFRTALTTLLGDRANAFHIHESFGHRWGRAFTKSGTDVRCDDQSIYVPRYRVGVCGDMFASIDGASPVECAWQSGHAVAATLVHHETLRSKI